MPPSRNATEARRASPRDGQGRSSAGTPLSRRVSWTHAASRETRAASSLGLSSRTSASRSPTRRGRSDSKVESQRDVMGDNLSPRTGGGGDGLGKSGPRKALVDGGACGFSARRAPRSPPGRRLAAGPGRPAARHLPHRAAAAGGRAAARGARGHAAPGGRPLPSRDLVELTSLDPTIRLDIRYATADNFLSTPVYARGARVPAAPRRRGARPRAPRPRGAGLRPAHLRRLPAVVGDEGVLGRDARTTSATSSPTPRRARGTTAAAPST